MLLNKEKWINIFKRKIKQEPEAGVGGGGEG